MPENNELFPYIKLGGSPREIGLRHGSVFKDRIAACYNFYRNLVPKASDETLEKLALEFRDSIKRFRPAYAEEIEAVAEGAEKPIWQIYLLNARTELIRKLKPPTECTSLFFRKTAIFGQTWDWAERLESLMVLLEITRPDGMRIITITEPGIIGKIGFNSKGLSVGLNILRSTEPLGGVPIHILERACLDSSSIDEARKVVSSAELGTMSNIMLGDQKGNGTSIEISGNKLGEWKGADEVVFHTNHYLELPVNNPRKDFESSFTRVEQVQKHLPKLKDYSVEEMKTVLGDTSNQANAICCEYIKDDIIDTCGTVTSLVIDLPKLEMHYTPGHPLRYPYRTVSLG